MRVTGKALKLALIMAVARPGAAWASNGPKADGADMDGPPRMEKSHFQDYLKQRIAAINRVHAGRMDFFEKDLAESKAFWEKIRSDREKFQIRLTRQGMDLFDSLRSLDPKSYAATIANFEKLQGDFMKSFEQEQKEKIQAFFAARAQRWSDFAAAQDADRAKYMADVQAGWQDDKTALLATVKTADGPAANARSKSSSSSADR